MYGNFFENKELVSRTANVFTGVSVTFALLTSLINLVLARWWQSVMYNPGELGKELRAIRMNYVATGLFVACIALGSMNITFIRELMLGFVLLFLIAGFSLMHYAYALKQRGTVWYVMSYIGLIIFIPYSFLVFIVAAIIDSFVDMRSKMDKSNLIERG